MKKIFLTLCSALMLLTVASQDLSQMIPSDAIMVAKINGKALNNKMSIDYLQNLAIMDELRAELRSMEDTDDLSKVGFDLTKNAYLFAEVNDSLSMMYILIPLNDRAAFEKIFIQNKRKNSNDNFVIDDEVALTWTDNNLIMVVGEINDHFIKTDSMFKQRYGLGSDPYDYGYNDSYYEEPQPVYTEDGNVYYPESNVAEAATDAADAVENAAEAVESAKDAVRDAAEEVIVEDLDVEETVIEAMPTETYWENGIEYYLNGEAVESAGMDEGDQYAAESDYGYDSYNNNSNNYYDNYDRYYQKKDSLSGAWLLASAHSLIANKGVTKKHSADIQKTLKATSDASVFVDYGRVMTSYMELLSETSMNLSYPLSTQLTNLTNIYAGMKMTADLTFKEEEVNLDIITMMDDNHANLYEGILDRKFNKKFLKHMDLKNALGYYSMSFNSEKILEMYPKLISYYMGFIPEAQGAGPAFADILSVIIDEEAISELWTGNAVAIFEGFTNQKMSYTSYDYNENFETVETVHETEEMLPSVLLMIESINNKPIQNLIAIAERYDAVEKTSYGFVVAPSSDMPVSTHIIFKGDIIYICNDENKMAKIVSGQSTGKGNKAHITKLKKNNLVAYINGEKLIENIPYTPYSDKDMKSWELLKSSLKDMEILQYQKSKNAIVTTMNVSTPAAMNNSWNYFWDTLNQFYIIETGK